MANKDIRTRVAKKGGFAPHKLRGLAATDPETRKRVASAGGKKRAGEPGALSEAGKKGGARVKELYGTEHYRKIGIKGGSAILETLGSEYYSTIGKKGGNAVVERHGKYYFSQIGHKGGETTKKKFEARKEQQDSVN